MRSGAGPGTLPPRSRCFTPSRWFWQARSVTIPRGTRGMMRILVNSVVTEIDQD
jgi:hypothetical protein